MKSITEIIKANKHYDDERKKIEELLNKTYLVNDELDLEEVKTSLNYAKTKELYETVMCRINNKNKLNELKKIMDSKKVEEYPEILKVHYYPIINQIEFLSEEQKIKLDATLKQCHESRILERVLYENLDEKVIDFLIQNEVLEKRYIFHCTCGSDECYDKIITQNELDKLKDYWEKELAGKTTHEEDEEMGYGCFCAGCWNDGTVEICCLEDFNKHLKKIVCKVIQKPDMTLDCI